MGENSDIIGLSAILNGKGGMIAMPINQPITLSKNDSGFWQHLDYLNPQTLSLLTKDYGLDSTVAEALCDEDTRPRFFTSGDGMVLILRGVNTNHKNEPDEMISLRIWLDAKRIITLSHWKLKAVQAIYNQLEEDKGPANSAQCFVMLANSLVDAIVEYSSDISDKTTDIEEEVIDNQDNLQNFNLRSRLSNLRRQIIGLRRYIAPQKDIFVNLFNDKTAIFSSHDKMQLREISNNISKAIEDLDYSKDHLSISHEELQSKVSINMSRIMYMISIVTVIFIPLGLITSLLGINVNGIPYAESHLAFAAVCGLLVILCAVLILLLKKLKWV